MPFMYLTGRTECSSPSRDATLCECVCVCLLCTYCTRHTHSTCFPSYVHLKGCFRFFEKCHFRYSLRLFRFLSPSSANFIHCHLDLSLLKRSKSLPCKPPHPLAFDPPTSFHFDGTRALSRGPLESSHDEI